MTDFSIEKLPFDKAAIDTWGATDPRHRNWPVVYVLNNQKQVYVGESYNVTKRLGQHLKTPEKQAMQRVRVVLDERFNKSACLDLETLLIQLFAGDGQLAVLNSNSTQTDQDYYERDSYRRTFEQVVDALRENEHLFKRTIPEIINSDLFKFSPFKALNTDQAAAAEDILDGLFEDLEKDVGSISVVQGNPGTGKTILAIYLLKLLEDIRRHDPEEAPDSDTLFSDYFTPEHIELLQDLRMGIVVPQQSLRQSIINVFKRTPGLSKSLVLTPFDVGGSSEPFDILIVDEAHRLNQRANQPSAALNKRFAEINKQLFGADDPSRTQLDWIRKQSKHAILMLDTGQSVRPADLPAAATKALLSEAHDMHRVYPLQSQMRVKAGSDYVGFVRSLLSDELPSAVPDFGDYDLRFFDDLSEMRREIEFREREHGLSRLIAGYAWEWKSKTDKSAFDIEIDGEQLRWNSTQKDWINSPGSINEVGSIHTVQGYDLNYAGVIIGRDLRLDPETGRIVFDRSQYFDKKGRENNPKRGITYSDEDLLEYVKNIYSVLLTRGIRGTYLYVCDPELRQLLRPTVQAHPGSHVE